MSKKMSKKRRDLVARLEQMIGSKCYNGNIQNYGPGGVFEGEGRSFRYPITYRNADGTKSKRSWADDSIPTESFVNGYYAFGANQLRIIDALDDILTYLESTHGLKV